MIMKVELKKEDLFKAWNKGCCDVREVLQNLYPDIDFYNQEEYIQFVEHGRYIGVEDVDKPIGIGNASVPDYMRHRCILLPNKVNWKIIDNPKIDSICNKLLVGTKIK